MTLLILAAGMGSRFGGLKQMEPFGPNDEFIIDYSVYDAKKAGFTKIVFVIRNLWRGGSKKLSSLYSTAQSRSELIATFLAVLELCKANRIKIEGENENQEITLIKGHNKR